MSITKYGPIKEHQSVSKVSALNQETVVSFPLFTLMDLLKIQCQYLNI